MSQQNPLSVESANETAQIAQTEEQAFPPPAAEKAEANVHSTSSSSASIPPEKKQRRNSSPSNNVSPVNELDALIAHLPEEEQQVLKQQLEELKVNITFFGLWRYATKIDVLILLVSAICAIAAGAALPLFTVSSLPWALNSFSDSF